MCLRILVLFLVFQLDIVGLFSHSVIQQSDEGWRVSWSNGKLCSWHCPPKSWLTSCHCGYWFHEARSMWSSIAHRHFSFLSLFYSAALRLLFLILLQPRFAIWSQLSQELWSTKKEITWLQFLSLSPASGYSYLYPSWLKLLLDSSYLFSYFPHTILTLWLRKITRICGLNLIEYEFN